MNSIPSALAQASESWRDECCRLILGKMSADFTKLSRIGDADARLYDQCVRLMAAYHEAISLYERFQHDFKSPEVREIIDGIITVLVSRLREFEEVASPAEGSNPIEDEKQLILARSLESLGKAIAEKWQAPSDPDLAGFAKRHILPALYEVCLEHRKLCAAQLSDLNSRRAVQTYLALMEDEWEILSNIIKMQVSALEQAMEPSADALEKIAVHKILSLLREAYQHFGRASTEINAVFHRMDDAAEHREESYDTFEAELLGCLEQDDSLDEYRANIENEGDILFGRLKLDFFKSIYRFRRMVSEEMLLAEDMANAFSELYKKWPVTENDGEAAEILRGISETIEIKIDGLRESIIHMTDECKKLIDSFAVPGETEREIIKAALWQQRNGEEIFAERLAEHEKNAARYEENLEKKLTKFKREILLYEISTYEEIIFYSVSRLREFPDMEFQLASAVADDTLYELSVLLKKNNI